MVIRPLRFNFYLLSLVLVLALALCGCETTASKSDKPFARLSIAIESYREAEGRSETITVSRASPITLHVQTSALLNETHIVEARLVDSFAGFTLVIQFNPLGTHLLEQYSAQYPGRHFAIAAQFGEKQVETRWIAAPLIKKRITDGMLAFTPDLSHAEADLFVRGLNNIAIETGNQQKSKTPPPKK